MKTLDVIIYGEVHYIDYCTKADKEHDEEQNWDEDWNLIYESLMLIEPDTVKVEGISYEFDDETDEYPWTIKYTPLFEHLFGRFGFPDEPMYMWVVRYKEPCVYKLQLEDDEEFDIHKLQLIQSYELNFLEDACLYGYVMYDGKKLEMTPEENDNHSACVMGSSHAWEYEIVEFDNEVKEDDPDYIEFPEEYR